MEDQKLELNEEKLKAVDGGAAENLPKTIEHVLLGMSAPAGSETVTVPLSDDASGHENFIH